MSHLAPDSAGAAASCPPLRIAVDLSILRHGVSGSSTYATGLYAALRDIPSLELRAWRGPMRRRWRSPIRKPFNAAQERYYYEIGLPAAARRWRADVLLMPVNLTARRTAIPQLVSILDVNFLLQPDAYDPWFRRYATGMFARAGRDAEIVTTISEYSRKQISAHLGINTEKIRVVYPGLDSPSPNLLSAPLSDPYALYFGATEPHKNIDLLLRSWEGRTDGLRLAIVGTPGRAHDSLREAARPFGDRVVITGAVDTSTRERWYSGATLFLFPSLTEGFGYPPLEAMQRGVPVIASHAGSLPEVLGDAALFHDPNDVAGLRHAVDRLIEDAALRRDLAEKGRTQAARYTWDRAADAMAKLLSQIARARTGAGTPR